MKVNFQPRVTAPVLDLMHGTLRRQFKRAEAPFEVTEEEWAILEPLGYFEVVPESAPAPSTDATTATSAKARRLPQASSDAPDEERL